MQGDAAGERGRDEVAQHLIRLGGRPRLRLLDRVAAVHPIEIQRAAHDHRLGQRGGAQAEVPVVVVAELAKTTERAEELALDEEIAGGDGDVVLHEREAVRVAAEEAPLHLPVAPCRRSRIGGRSSRRRLRRAFRDLSDQRETPRETGARDGVDQRGHAIGRVVVVRVEEAEILAACERRRLVQRRRRAPVRSRGEAYGDGQPFDRPGDDIGGAVRRSVVDDDEFQIRVRLRGDGRDRLTDEARMVVRRHDDGHERRFGGLRGGMGLLPREKILHEARLPRGDAANEELPDHEPQVVADLRAAPSRCAPRHPGSDRALRGSAGVRVAPRPACAARRRRRGSRRARAGRAFPRAAASPRDAQPALRSAWREAPPARRPVRSNACSACRCRRDKARCDSSTRSFARTRSRNG